MGAQGWMMIDGKLNPRALPALYAPGMAEDVFAVLQGTVYEPIAASGPLMARVHIDSELFERWRANEAPVRDAWYFTSPLSPYALTAYWRRRLLIRGPMGRTLWLRYADGRVLARGIEQRVFPDAFWHAIASLRLSAPQGEWLPLPVSGRQAWEEPDDDALRPLFTFDERQLASLSPSETAS